MPAEHDAYVHELGVQGDGVGEVPLLVRPEELSLCFICDDDLE